MTRDLSDRQRSQRKAAIASRWGGRGRSVTVRVDPEAAAALATLPERDRRRVASDAILSAVNAISSSD